MSQLDDRYDLETSVEIASPRSALQSQTARLRPEKSVGIVDSQPLYRKGIIQVLRAHGRMSVVAEGDTTNDALQMAANSSLDILLLDLALIGGGHQVHAELLRTRPAMKLVLLATSEQEEDVAGALSCGASGYILRHVRPDEFIAALQAIAIGEIYLTPSLGAKLIARSAASTSGPAPPGNGLTARENEIIAQVAIGAKNKEIARKLNITEKTVKHYMTAIMQKLQVRNRVEAVVLMRDRARNSA